MEKPFDRLRFWTLLPWCLAGYGAALCIGRAINGLGGSVDTLLIERAEAIGAHAVLFGWVVWAVIHYRVDIRRLIGPPLTRRQILYLLVTSAVFYLFTQGAFFLVTYPLSVLWPDFVGVWVFVLKTEPTTLYTYNVSTVAYLIAYFLLIVPIVEETLFRGLLLHRWATKWGLNRALIGTSMLFSLLHLDLLGIFAGSLAMAIVYVRTRSLLAPIVVHAGLNALGTFLPTFPADTFRTVREFQATWPYGVGCLLVSLPFVVLFFVRHWPAKEALAPYFDAPSIVLEPTSQHRRFLWEL